MSPRVTYDCYDNLTRVQYIYEEAGYEYNGRQMCRFSEYSPCIFQIDMYDVSKTVQWNDKKTIAYT